MLVLEAKFTEKSWQYELLEAAIYPANFIRNKSARYRMDHHGISKNDRQKLYTLLAKELERAGKLNSQARQASTDRAWAALSRFYTNCKDKEPVKKGYQLENPNCLKQSEKSLKRVHKSLNTRTHKCPDFGLIQQRDLNAAKNILARGLGLKSTVGYTETPTLAETDLLACTEKSTRVKVDRRTKNPTKASGGSVNCLIVCPY